MKKVAILGLLTGALMMGNIGFSQDEHPAPGEHKERKADMTPEERAKKHTERMTKELSLTDEQAKDLEKINLAYAKKREEIKEKREALRAESQEIRKNYEGELDEILTDEQKAKLEEKKAERREKRKHHKPHHGKRP